MEKKNEINTAFFSVKNIEKSYGTGSAKVKVLDGVSTELYEGEICVILGPSGSGKSTFLNVAGGLESIDGGSITIDGQDISKMDPKSLGRYRRDKLGFVFQFYNLIPNLTVKENIEVCAYLSKNPLEIDELLHTLGLWEHKDKFPNQLSGGQQQRCAIGRALVKNPALLLCDELTGALDYKTAKEILALIEKINQTYHNTIIIVTHNEPIKNMAHRVLKLHDGRIVKDYVNETQLSAKDLEW
ncbi:ATP-binding cassette domain-containing protein [Acetobacterium fimetarium]|uniref:ATP-binding cassette domain-containing protein n=1 Tax=Acetobacterium fimetarium TaxID=52691 RepID=A0ABR6WUM5_9FIRM|nr:ABC transporter ATP-binding protein [Acetobacterium fimetarium]MBC3804291.1 ATP-binding cassette domain-containing protein [Acetobacterium fimetarium]